MANPHLRRTAIIAQHFIAEQQDEGKRTAFIPFKNVSKSLEIKIIKFNVGSYVPDMQPTPLQMMFSQAWEC
jgi:hypothetical protein